MANRAKAELLLQGVDKVWWLGIIGRELVQD